MVISKFNYLHRRVDTEIEGRRSCPKLGSKVIAYKRNNGMIYRTKERKNESQQENETEKFNSL